MQESPGKPAPAQPGSATHSRIDVLGAEPAVVVMTAVPGTWGKEPKSHTRGKWTESTKVARGDQEQKLVLAS